MTPTSGLLAKALRTTVLRGVDIAAARGEILALRGASGSGKSALLRAIADLDPNEGEVWLDGAARSAMAGASWRRRVRFIAAETAWWRETVGEHFRTPATAAEAAVDLGLDPRCMAWEVARLSTGEKQRLALIRALEDSPEVLLLDEPTAALDEAATAAVERLIADRRDDGAAILIVTHDDAQAERLCDRRLSIADGRLQPEDGAA